MNSTDRLPAEQLAIRDRCRHPAGGFLEFDIADVEQSIAARFERQVQLYPQRTAVKSLGARLTYQELNQAANRVAYSLIRRRGNSREAVALLFETDTPAIIAMLAALKSGKFFVMLDPYFPQDRLEGMLEASGAQVLLTSGAHADLAQMLSGGRLEVMDIDQIERNAEDQNRVLPLVPSDLAYIIFTSGSTGKPKGIMFDHRSVLFGVRNYTNAFRIGIHDRLTLLHSPSFSSGIVDILCALLNGAAVYPWNLKRDGMSGLEAWLTTEGITILDWVPTPFRYFAGILSQPGRFPDVRLLILASEPVYSADVEIYRSNFSPACIFVNRLGATETWNFRLNFIDHQSKLESGLVPAGYAVPGKRLLLVDEDGHEVGPNEVGEIFIQSRYLAVGYWQHPELTEAAFLPDPSSGDERIYKTGDLGLLRSDGCLEYRGRKDSQVKVRGYRIETSEIEAALNGLEAIREAVVVAREVNSSEKQLVAYVVPAVKGASVAPAAREALARRLPDYMVPASFVELDALPVTPTGKIDRRALPAPRPSSPAQSAGAIAPRDEIEYQLEGLWEKILGRGPFSVTDNFFEVGGHSLSAMRLLVEIERIFAQRLPQTILLQFPTVETLAAVIRENRMVDETSFPSVLALNSDGSQAPLFCMPGILGNVFSDLGSLARSFAGERPVYGLQDGLRLPSHVKPKAKAFLKEITAIQPHGPYLLVGICSGALTMSEIAWQLRQRGEEVAVLALIEPAMPWKTGPRSWPDFAYNVYHRFIKRIDHHARSMGQLSVGEQARYLRAKLKLVSNMWGSRHYAARPQQQGIHILATRASLTRKPRAFQWAWDRFAASAICRHEIPGTHNSITGDYDTEIEDELMQAIGDTLKRLIAAGMASKPGAQFSAPTITGGAPKAAPVHT